MNRINRRTMLRHLVLATVVLFAPSVTASAASAQGRMVVANRGAGTISVIDVATNTVTATVNLPPGDRAPEPMYVVHTRHKNRIWVGDRANNRVVVFSGDTLEVIRTVPCGAGVFHMWADSLAQELWVVNDLDNTATVISTRRMEVLATVPMPADLVARGAHPHDVVLDPFGLVAYVSMVNVDPTFDIIVQFWAPTGEEINRVQVGKDPHVSFNWRTWEVFSPCQNSNTVFVLDGVSLEINDMLDIPGAHGAVTSLDAKRFYTTNLPGLGQNAIFGINTKTLEVLGPPANTPSTVPHNLALTPNGRTLYVTHSGANNKVSVFRTRSNDTPELIGQVTVGTNPFGIAFAP